LNLSADTAVSADLVFTEWGRDVTKAASGGVVADLSPYWPRLQSEKKLWPVLGRSVIGKGRFFLPATIYTWGLFYNKSVLDSNGIAYPGSFNAFEAALAKLKAQGVMPIALGTASGWPAVAWLSYLDIRLNGLAAHQKLLSGERPFDDQSLDKVYATLEKWRDDGWFEEASASRTWSDALAEVDGGHSAFLLMGAFAANRFTNPDAVRWGPVPSGRVRDAAGEMVVAQGFVLSAKARAPEAALSLADAYVASGTSDLTTDAFSMPAIVQSSGAKPQEANTLAAVKSTEADILRRANALVPQLDRFLPPDAAYLLNQTMIQFFTPEPRMSKTDLETALKGIVVSSGNR
jgi:ABC-type glycerol-3-phosphate transport system substrate-binding protein